MTHDEIVVQTCDHNCVPCRGGIRHRFCAGWVCVRCGEWGREVLPRLCPDCRLGPDQGENGDCYWCRESYEQKKRDEAMFASGYEAGYEAGDHAHRTEGDW